MKPQLDQYFQNFQKRCLPGVWSLGVSLSREGAVKLDSTKNTKDGEVQFRILKPGKTVSQKVTLWLEEDDYSCDCDDKADPCSHVAAAVIALKTGAKPQNAFVTYRFITKEGALVLERFISKPDETNTPLQGTLTALLGGIQSGRVDHPPLSATQSDLQIDQILNQERNRPVPRATMTRIFLLLRDQNELTLDGEPVLLGKPLVSYFIRLKQEQGGFRIEGVQDPCIQQVFRNGIAKCLNETGTLEIRELLDPGLTPFEKGLIKPGGTFFLATASDQVFSKIVPDLEKKIRVEKPEGGMPEVVHCDPRIVLNLQHPAPDTLSVVANLVYGNPPLAIIKNGAFEFLNNRVLTIRDSSKEQTLTRKLQNELYLSPDQLVYFKGDEAIRFQERLKDWDKSGLAVQSFTNEGALEPLIELSGSKLNVQFRIKGELKALPATTVFSAWRKGQNYVQLMEGGWAELPNDWLKRFGKQVEGLMSLQEREQKLPKYFTPTVQQLFEDLELPEPKDLKRLKELLEDFQKIPDTKPPKDLVANLRHYQVQGMNWLCFLRDAEMGAILADDMGLGKTLQALTSIRGKTLVVVPTSVLTSWQEQIDKFRPKLKVGLFHGSARKLNPKLDVTLTTYALLRLDREILCGREWDTIILDEAQNIKNPQSLTSRVAHQLKGKFKIALSGTPIENRLDDLWSQMHFVNPGLLGTYEEFMDEFVDKIQKGSPSTTARLHRRIKPFILRRLKKEVAPELPERTEIILHCELSEAETNVYQSIWAATQKEVIERLNLENNVLALLEVLLRLRQAACHCALIPGQTAATSSKVELLVETLANSIEQGHRALIFSQWTSLLDLIEPHLKKNKITFSRIDGSTSNRGEIVTEFQKPDGPNCMLLSLKAGGTGLTLTAADHVFIIDPWWNPAVENQAADRAHRIGQKNPVLIHRLVAKDTIEDKILLLQKKKQELASSVLREGGSALAITREDLMALLNS